MHRCPLTSCIALLVCLAVALPTAWSGEVVLRYFRGGMMPAGQQDVVEEFERRNPGIRVVAGITASRNMVSDPQRLLCAIVGGDPPDVVMFDRYAVAEWAARGAFRPLDEFLARDRDRPDGIRARDFFAPTWQEAQWDGKVYAVPSGTDNRALYYNKDRLVRAGFVDADGEARPPRTWDELEDYAVKLSEFVRGADGEVTSIRRVGFIPNYGNCWFYFYSWLNDGALLSDDGRRCTLASEANIEAMTYVVKLYDRLHGARLVNAFQSSFQGAELDPFLTGRVAMKIDGNWVLSGIGTYRRDLNFAVAPAPLPRERLEAGASYISWSGGWSWVIPSGAKHPEEAWRLIRWLASEEAAIILSDANREANLAQGKIFIPSLSANKRITQTLYRRYLVDDPTIEPKFRDAYQVFVNLLPQSRFRPVTPVGQFLWNQQVRAMEGSIYHERGMTPEQIDKHIRKTLARHTAEVQRELDRVYRIRTEPKVNWAVPLVAYLVLLASVAGLLWWRHRRQSASRGYFRREYRAGVLFAMPWIIGFVVFTGGPILFSFIISFCEYDVLSPGRWVGLRNYEYLLDGDPVFWKSLTNTLFMLIGLPLGMAVSLGLAMLLNAKVKGMSAWRTFFYLPAIMPAVAAALLWLLIFQPTHGLMNQLLRLAGWDWLMGWAPRGLDCLLVAVLMVLPLWLAARAALGALWKTGGPSALRLQPFARLLAALALAGAGLVLAWHVGPTKRLLVWLLVLTGDVQRCATAFLGGWKLPVLWLQSETTSKPALIVMGLWGAGAGMIIWLAGLKGIPQHLYEAAKIDGAGRWRKFRHITLPMLTPYIFFNLLMGMIATLQQFQSAYIMTEGGPVDSTLFFGYHLFNNAFRFFRMGQGSAMAWVLCVIVMVITVIQLKTARIWVHYESE